MEQTENKEKVIERIEDLPEFKIGKIRDETFSEIFRDIYNDEEKLKEFIKKFDDIYYMAVSPFEIEKYKDNETLYEILQRYKHTAENHKLELMIFKLKEMTEEEKQKILEKLKKEYEGFEIKLDDSKYGLIIGFFGGSTGRTNSCYMEEIKEIYPVKELK